MDLTIIVPIYNINEKIFVACLESLVKQIDGDCSMILVDDGSTNRCGEICDEYASKYDFISVIHQPNQGVSSARNVGIKNAESKWIAFVDPDDYVDDRYIGNIRSVIGNIDDHFDMVIFDYFKVYTDKTFKYQLPIPTGHMSQDVLDAFKISTLNHLIIDNEIINYEVNVVWNKVFRRSFIEENNLSFKENTSKNEDAVFMCEAYIKADSIYYLNEPLYYYNCFSYSITNKYNKDIVRQNELTFKEYYRIIRENSLLDEYLNAYYFRIVTRLYSYLRLYYLHNECNLTFKEVKKEFKALLNKEPYKTAIYNLKPIRMTFEERIFIFFIRYRNLSIIRLLVKLRDMKSGLTARLRDE